MRTRVRGSDCRAMPERGEPRGALAPRLPVSQLSGNVLTRFERARPFLANQFRASVEGGALSPEVVVDVEPVPVRTPRVGGTPAVFQLHEPFLQYLWAISFSLLVLDQEGHRRAQVGVPPHSESEVRVQLLHVAERVFGWALEARYSAPEWLRGWPRPDRPVTRDETDYVSRANGLYVNAAAYILLHEYAHVTLHHLDVVDGVDAEVHTEIEADADAFAREALLDSGTEAGDDLSRRAGVIVAHCAMLFLAVEGDADRERAGRFRLKQASHPDLDDRLLHALKSLDPEEVGREDLLWTMAGCALQVFLVRSGRTPGDMEVGTAREWVDRLLEEVDALKRGEAPGA